MAKSKVHRVLIVIAANIGLTLAFLGLVEAGCRWLEARSNSEESTKKAAARGRLPAKAPGEFRVCLFGGSTVYGEPVPEVAFASQMRYWLKRLYPDRDIRIYNFGYPGSPTLLVRGEFLRRLDEQPDLMVVITGHNEFLFPDQASQRTSRLRDALSTHSAAMRQIERVSLSFRRSNAQNVMPVEVNAWDQRSERFLSRVRLFEQSMSEMISKARERRIPLIMGTLPSNLADWPPVYKRLPGRDAQYIASISIIQQLIGEGRYSDARDAVAAGFSRFPDDAMLYFLRGKIQAATRDYTAARESFVKARDLDPIPWRTSSLLNDIIRRTASGGGGVELLDLEKIYDQHAENGLVGFDLIGDNVHGAPMGESISAQAIIETLSRMGFLGDAKPIGSECCPVSKFLNDVGYFSPKSPLRLSVMLKNGIYAMKTPFLYYDLARKYLLDAMQVDQDSWEVWANLGTLSYLTGDAVAGAKELNRATALHGKPLDPNDRDKTPYLKEALQFAGKAGSN